MDNNLRSGIQICFAWRTCPECRIAGPALTPPPPRRVVTRARPTGLSSRAVPHGLSGSDDRLPNLLRLCKHRERCASDSTFLGTSRFSSHFSRRELFASEQWATRSWFVGMLRFVLETGLCLALSSWIVLKEFRGHRPSKAFLLSPQEVSLMVNPLFPCSLPLVTSSISPFLKWSCTAEMQATFPSRFDLRSLFPRGSGNIYHVVHDGCFTFTKIKKFQPYAPPLLEESSVFLWTIFFQSSMVHIYVSISALHWPFSLRVPPAPKKFSWEASSQGGKLSTIGSSRSTASSFSPYRSLLLTSLNNEPAFPPWPSAASSPPLRWN